MVVQPGTQQSLLKGVACLLHPPPCPPAGCMVTQPSHFASACLSFNPWPLLLASSRCSGSLTRIQAAADAWRVRCLLSCLGRGQELGGRPKKKKKARRGQKQAGIFGVTAQVLAPSSRWEGRRGKFPSHHRCDSDCAASEDFI